MRRLRYLLVISIPLIITGAAVVSLLIEFFWLFFSGRNYIPLNSLVSNFIIGLIVGSSVILLHLLAMRFMKKPLIGYVISAMVILAILAGVYVQTGLSINNWDLDLKWLIIVLLSEGITIPYSIFWNRKMNHYNRLLEAKKSNLKQTDQTN